MPKPKLLGTVLNSKESKKIRIIIMEQISQNLQINS